MISTPGHDRKSQDDGLAGRGNSSAGQAGEQVKKEFSRTAEDMRRQGESLARTAQEEARSFANEQKDHGADRIHGFAQSVNKAADDLEESSPQLARYARKAASSVDQWSNALRERSIGDMVTSASNLARREPVAFFGAAMVAGFAMSRLLKSTEDRHPTSAAAGTTGHTTHATGTGRAGDPYGTTTATGPGMSASQPGQSARSAQSTIGR